MAGILHINLSSETPEKLLAALKAEFAAREFPEPNEITMIAPHYGSRHWSGTAKGSL